MELCMTVRSLLAGRPKAGESGPRAEPSIRTPHARPDLLHAVPLRPPSSATKGHRRNPPARAPPQLEAPARPAARPAARRPWRRLLPHPTLRPLVAGSGPGY